MSPAVRDGKMNNGLIELSTDLWETTLKMPPRWDAEKVDEKDADTPDNWVQRHEAMVRLTGRHPFNTEPPLKLLQDAGWITPPSIHVVRNHGAVPRLPYEKHMLKITGVPKPCELSMDELVSGNWGEIVSIPVTFICAGNRRKEQNMTKKTVGFNWGCAAVGNSVWTGIRLSDLLKALGVTKASKEHRFVHFEGPEGELPQGKTGSYGTSIDMGWALDRERDVLLAFKQNGELLTPDHGAPLRTLLPGCIGGRMIKWLCKMHVSDQPSDNHYHFFDNRVLPPHVDAELATAEGWWYKPEYIINHMNINSAMFEPRHNSTFPMSGKNTQKTLKVCGYAYTGGGNMIIRAEISLDSGRSWEIADLSRPEDEIAEARGTDKHWCWSWWETEVDVARLEGCTEICCRAFDSTQNSQPFQLTWNVMGMLSNTIFRIRLHRTKDDEGNDMIWFEHPTMPGAESGGWMTEGAGKFDPSIASEASPGRTSVAPSRAVAAVWNGAGEDALTAGSRSVAATVAAPAAANVVSEAGNPILSFISQINPFAKLFAPSAGFLQKNWQKLPLVEKIVVSSDTRIFRFGLPSPNMRLGLPTGMHMFLRAKSNGQTVMRPYSPMTDDETVGHVDLLVKVYFAGVHPQFPKGGLMSQHLDSLKIGDTIDVKGPVGDFVYKGKGNFTYRGKDRSCTHISMIAGGTGLTPCYQVINAVLRNPKDTTKVSLLYANRSPDDILAKETLDKLAAAHPDRFRLTYTVDKKPEGPWTGLVGFVNEAMIKECLFPASESGIVAMCGPPIMVEKACLPNLKTLGHSEEAIFEF